MFREFFYKKIFFYRLKRIRYFFNNNEINRMCAKQDFVERIGKLSL